MKCINCGTEIADGAKFCPKCGSRQTAPVETQNTGWQAAETQAAAAERSAEPQQTVYSAPAAKEPKKKSRLGLIIAIAVVIVLAAAAAVWFFFLRCPDVHVSLNAYIVLEAEGYDGYGDVTASIDFDSLTEDLEDAKLKWTGKQYPDGYTPLEFAEAAIWLKETSWNGMTNGETVKIEPDLSTFEEFESNLIIDFDEDQVYTVEGLKEVTAFNPFENFEVTITGTEGDTIVEYRAREDIKAMEIMYIGIDPDSCDEYGLHNGDVIRFYIDDADDGDTDLDIYASAYGMVPETTEFLYTVEGLPMGDHYVTNVSEIPEEIWTELEDSTVEELLEYWQSNGVECKAELAYRGYAVPAEENAYYENVMLLLFKYTIYGTSNEEFVTWVPVYTYDVAYDADTESYSAEGGTECWLFESDTYDNHQSFEDSQYTYTMYGFESESAAKTVAEEDLAEDGSYDVVWTAAN